MGEAVEHPAGAGERVSPGRDGAGEITGGGDPGERMIALGETIVERGQQRTELAVVDRAS